jgi:hypothetical protein
MGMGMGGASGMMGGMFMMGGGMGGMSDSGMTGGMGGTTPHAWTENDYPDDGTKINRPANDNSGLKSDKGQSTAPQPSAGSIFRAVASMAVSLVVDPIRPRRWRADCHFGYIAT